MSRGAGDLTLRRGAPPAQGAFLGLAVTRGRRRPLDLWHVGVLYRGGDGDELRLMEMLGDAECVDRAALHPDVGLLQRYAWAPLPLAPTDHHQALVLCQTVGAWIRANGSKVRLSFVYNGGDFDPATGALRPASGESGLYCSTVALALFLSAAVELLDRGTWSPTSEMNTWIEGFARMLRDVGERQRNLHILQQRPCVVFHPLEVMSVCTAGRIGVDASTARIHRQTLSVAYDRLFPRMIR